MSIELHCTKCGKLVRAPDDAGGRRGKCPYCGESVYIPLPPDENDEIRIAPVDEEEERRAEELRRESTEYFASVGHGTDVPETGGAADTGRRADATPAADEVVDIDLEVEAYIAAMRDSKLDIVEQTSERLKGTGSRARDYVQNLLHDEMLPEVKGVPPPLIKAFLKKLLDRMTE
jgi:hypothetical protein